MSHQKPEECRIIITVAEARNLPAADANGKSDPYVLIKDTHGIAMKGKGQKTSVIKKNLNPVWNEAYEFVFNYKLAKLVFVVYDHDTFGKDDLLGKVNVPIDHLFDLQEHDQWYPLKRKHAASVGELRLKLRVVMGFPIVREGAHLLVQEANMTLGLGWDVGKKMTIDLDASVVELDANKQEISVANFAHRNTNDGAIMHMGDNRTGEGTGDDEEVKLNFAKLNPAVMYIAITINSFTLVPLTKVKSSYVRVRSAGGATLLLSRLSKLSDSSGVFFGFFKREPNGWFTFHTVAKPIQGRAISEGISDIRSYLDAMRA